MYALPDYLVREFYPRTYNTKIIEIIGINYDKGFPVFIQRLHVRIPLGADILHFYVHMWDLIFIFLKSALKDILIPNSIPNK